MLESDKKLAEFIKDAFSREFNGRVIIENRRKGSNSAISLLAEQTDEALLFKINVNNTTHCILIPLPKMHRGVYIIENNGIRRSMGKFYLAESGRSLSYLDAVNLILFGQPESMHGILPRNMVKKYPAVQQIAYAIEQGRTGLAIHHIQRSINKVLSMLPLYTTAMNAWVMNRRVCIIDPEFDAISNPMELNKYQVDKATRYFNSGFSPLGQADSAMADKNYLLSIDLRKLSPFGLKHHNPQRNLYSTLGMRGPELPMVRSKSMQDLIDRGVSRGGWNFFTVFLDTKDVWEDQILVNSCHLDKFVSYKKRYQCYGDMLVKKGDHLKWGQKISVVDDETDIKFDVRCDGAVVKSIKTVSTNVGGLDTVVHNVVVEYKRGFKNGIKITNLSANKGVVRFKDLGYATDPRTGEKRRIDVIVSSKAVLKRKNYTQILEALVSNCNDDKDEALVFPDDAGFTVKELEALLDSKGFPKDGTWKCHTYIGNFEAVCGTVFWGVTHDAEDTIWEEGVTERVNGRELRNSGLKFSPIEFRALETRFGKNNPITEEILQYAQGHGDIHEKLNIIRSKRGELPEGKQIVSMDKVKCVSKKEGTIIAKEKVIGTVVDETYIPEGFILKLPVTYQVVAGEDGVVEHEGFPVFGNLAPDQGHKKVFNIDQLYIPSSNLRKCWKHGTGRFGLSDIGMLVNDIVELGHMYMANTSNTQMYQLLYSAITRYFTNVASSLTTKRGDLSVYGMSVRHPFSAKAVATLSSSLPKNTIRIHADVAKSLDLKRGDIVLVERFPCLGFMSLRPQKIEISHNPLDRYTFTVSGNSLGSLSLDFDGDTIYIAAFYSEAAIKALKCEFTNPNKSCYDAITDLNEKMGHPMIRSMSLHDYNVCEFEPLTARTHAEIVAKLAGVKNNTGPVIALVYNIMRIVENSTIDLDQNTNVAIELFLDKVANSVFKQKHGAKSLHSIVIDAICTGDVDALVAEGFARNTSQAICDIIADKARTLGVKNLAQYHEYAKKRNSGNIITRIVREQNKIYFASRAQLEGLSLLKHLEYEAVDIPSKLLVRNLKGEHKYNYSRLDEKVDKKLMLKLGKAKGLTDPCRQLFAQVDNMLWGRDLTSKKKSSNQGLMSAFLPKRTNANYSSSINYEGGSNGWRQEVLGYIN